MYKFKGYTFDSVLGALYHQEGSIQLRPKLAQLLEYFLINAGRVITREELLSEIWINGEYRESSLTQSIRELRKQLNDNVHDPVFIKTYPQRGYIWLTEVELEQEETQPEPVNQKTSNLGHKNPYILFMVVGIFALVVSAGLLYQSNTNSVINSTAQTQQNHIRRILIAPFINETGETKLDWLNYSLRHMLIEGLKELPNYNVVPDNTALQLLAAESPKFNNQEQALDSIVVSGRADQWMLASVSQEFGRFVFRYQLSQPNGERKEGVIYSEGLDLSLPDLANSFIKQFNKGTNKLSTFKVSDNQFSTKDYLEGLHALETHGVGLAIRYFEASSLHDPSNTHALIELARSYWRTGQVEKAQALFAKLEEDTELQAQSNLRVRLLFYWGELEQVLGNYEESERLLKLALANSEELSNEVIRSRIYLVLSDVASKQQKWELYKDYVNLSKVGINLQNDVSTEATRLYYIGSPPAARPEQVTDVNLNESLESLHRSLSYYQKNNNLSLLMQTYFAIGQNFVADINSRAKALKKALELAIEQEEIIYKIKIANYLGFFYIQLHDGQRALKYLQIAQSEFNTGLENSPLYYRNRLLEAMGKMDLGISLVDPDLLDAADGIFTEMESSNVRDYPHIQADAHLLHGWTLLIKQEYQKALPKLTRAQIKYQSLGLNDSKAYADYSLMYAYLQLGNYSKAIELFDDSKNKKLLFDYAAIAHLQLEQFDEAEKLLLQSKSSFSGLWREQDERLLGFATRVMPIQKDNSISTLIDQWQKPYSVYCESEWGM